MKSITARFTVLVTAAILLSVAVVGGLSMITLRDKVDEDAVNVVNLTCANEAQRINATLAGIEQAVDLEASYALDCIDSTKRFFDDEDFRHSYTDQTERLFLDVAGHTRGAITFYFRYNAEEVGSTQGFLYTRENSDASFAKVPLTDIAQFDPDDDEHVGWYYQPLRNGRPTWMTPYHNKNLGIFMISYVVPVFSDERFIGVIGMDVDFDVVVSKLAAIHPFESAYAALVARDGTVYYHPDLEYGVHLDGSDASLPDIEAYLQGPGSEDHLVSYTYQGKDKRLAYHALQNGMDLLLAADAEDIDADRNRLIVNLVVAALAIVALFAVLAVASSRRTLRPLRDLTEAASEVSRGNLDISLPTGKASEVNTLIEAYRSTVERMREQLDIIHEMAHRDALTKLWNKSSYDERLAALDRDIAEGGALFALVMVDANDLKRINDVHGHERGDEYLRNSARVMKEAFGEDDVYRIGGDEFVIVAQGDGLDSLDAAVAEFELEAAQAPAAGDPWERPSLAYGVARFDAERDTCAQDVFKRADAAMYEKKQSMKARR